MPFSYQHSAKSGKLIPKHKLCPRCSRSRVNDKWGLCNGCYRDVMLGRAGIKLCHTCNKNPVPDGQQHCQACITYTIRERAKAQVADRMQLLFARFNKKKDRRPKGVPVPAPGRWNLTICWNCSREKGELIPQISLYCAECYFHPCREADCPKKAQYVRNDNGDGHYRMFCEEHHNQHVFCRKCLGPKPYSGLDLCPACSEAFARHKQRLLVRAFNKQWLHYYGAARLCIRCRREPQLHEGYCRACLEGFGRAVVKAKRIPKPPRLDNL